MRCDHVEGEGEIERPHASRRVEINRRGFAKGRAKRRDKIGADYVAQGKITRSSCRFLARWLDKKGRETGRIGLGTGYVSGNIAKKKKQKQRKRWAP